MRYILLGMAALLAAACAEESGLPTPSGKGTVRGINAIPASPPVTFRIEERSLGASMNYKSVTDGVRYDDFEYNFNFDTVPVPGDASERLASVPYKVDPNGDYTFVLAGDLDAPEVLVWEGEERTFDDGATVFELRFAHLAPSMGPVDVYLAPADVDPVAGMAIGTVEYGEILPPLDLTAEQKAFTLTRAGDPADVVYETLAISYSPRIAYIATLFDGDEADVSPLSLRLATAGSVIGTLADVRYDAAIRFFHAQATLPSADVYADEVLAAPLASGLSFGGVTGDLPFAAGESTVTWTAAGNPGAVLFDEEVETNRGTHNNFIVTEDLEDGSTNVAFFIPDRRSVSTYAKFQLFHAAGNQEDPDTQAAEVLNIYIVDEGSAITELLPRFAITYGAPGPIVALPAGTYELYATASNSKTPIAGPTSLDVEAGDVVEALLLDTVDPSAAEFSIVPAP